MGRYTGIYSVHSMVKDCACIYTLQLTVYSCIHAFQHAPVSPRVPGVRADWVSHADRCGLSLAACVENAGTKYSKRQSVFSCFTGLRCVVVFIYQTSHTPSVSIFRLYCIGHSRTALIYSITVTVENVAIEPCTHASMID